MPNFVVFVLRTNRVIKFLEINTKFVVIIIILYIQFWINRKLKNCAWKQGGSSCHLETFSSKWEFFIVFRHCEIEINTNRQPRNVTKQTAVLKNWFLAESIYILVPSCIAFSWIQMHHGMLHEHGKVRNFAGKDEVCYCLVLSNHRIRIQN